MFGRKKNRRGIPTLAIMVMFVAATMIPAPEQAKAATKQKTFTITAADLPSAVRLMKIRFNMAGTLIALARQERPDMVLEAAVSSFGLPHPSMVTIMRDGVYTIDLKGGAQIWTLYLGNQLIPVDIVMNLKGLAGTIDLGGLHLRNLSLNLTATALDFDFSEPTTLRVNSIRVQGAGSRVTLAHIGNTDFKYFRMFETAIDAGLDFRGAYGSPLHRVMIGGLSNLLACTLPRSATLGTKVNIIYPTPLSVIVRGDVLRDNWYRSVYPFNARYAETDYVSKDQKLDITVTTAGSYINFEQE